MAETARDFTDDNSQYQQVVFQRGRVVIDGELNEIGRLVRVQRNRSDVLEDHTAHSVTGAGGSGQDMFPVAMRNVIIRTNEDDGGIDPNDVILRPSADYPSYIKAYGYVWELTGDITWTTTANNTGVGSFQQLYFLIEEIPITPSDDPNIQVNAVGETANRVQLKVTPKIGDINVDEGPNEWTAAQPWNGGKKACLVAMVHRDISGGIMKTHHVQPRWRLPMEQIDLDRRLFNPNVQLRSSPYQGNGVPASAWLSLPGSPGGVSIENLNVVIGVGNYTPTDLIGFHSVVISGAFTLAVGEALVVHVPTEDTAPPQYSGTPRGEWTGVLTTPEPNELQVEVVPIKNVGSDVSIGGKNPGRYTLIPVCARLQDETIGEPFGPVWDDYIVFADGKILTKRAETSQTTQFLKSRAIVWPMGNRWRDQLYPQAFRDTISLETRLDWQSDRTPWDRTYCPAQVHSAKLIEEHVLRVIGEGSDVRIDESDELIMTRIYQARRFSIDFEGEERFFTGRMVTVNAWWDPRSEGLTSPETPLANGRWKPDDTSQDSNIEYQGFWDMEGENGDGFTGSANMGSGAVKWAANAWDNGEGPAGIQVFRSRKGSTRIMKGVDSVAFLEDYRKIHFAEGNPPVRVAGVTPSKATNEIYACTGPLAYGSIVTDGAGGVTLEDGAYNIDSVALFDDGPGPPTTNQAYVEFTFKNNPLTANYIAQASMMYLVGGLVDTEAFTWTLVPRAISNSVCRLHCTIGSHNIPPGDQLQRPLADYSLRVNIIMFGGVVP